MRRSLLICFTPPWAVSPRIVEELPGLKLHLMEFDVYNVAVMFNDIRIVLALKIWWLRQSILQSAEIFSWAHSHMKTNTGLCIYRET